MKYPLIVHVPRRFTENEIEIRIRRMVHGSAGRQKQQSVQYLHEILRERPTTHGRDENALPAVQPDISGVQREPHQCDQREPPAVRQNSEGVVRGRVRRGAAGLQEERFACGPPDGLQEILVVGHAQIRVRQQDKLLQGAARPGAHRDGDCRPPRGRRQGVELSVQEPVVREHLFQAARERLRAARARQIAELPRVDVAAVRQAAVQEHLREHRVQKDEQIRVVFPETLRRFRLRRLRLHRG